MRNAAENWLLPDEDLDLTNCDREPIHIPGAIQAHGYLVALDADGEIHFHSANLMDLAPTVRQSIARAVLDVGRTGARTGRWRAQPIDTEEVSGALIVHQLDGWVIGEVEPLQSGQPPFPYASMLEAIDEMADADDVAAVHEVAVRAIRGITGFDRVMAYLFDHEGHGAVIAEARSPSVDSFLGLRFPESDIPKQARKLYSLQPSRIIVDTGSGQVPVVAASEEAAQLPLNMAFCQLRSVSPVHIQYLQNMGVHASCSFSIMAGTTLAGLIACHHHQPRFIDFNCRTAAEVIARNVSEQLRRLVDVEKRGAVNRRLSAQVDLLAELADDEQLGVDNKGWSRIAGFVPHDAFLMRFDDDKKVLGLDTVVTSAIWDAAASMAAERRGACSATEDLAAIRPGAVGGLLVVPVGETTGWLAWYRQPIVRTVVWAGKPPSVGTGKELSPRASFAAWREEIRTRSAIWSAQESDLAEVLRRALAIRYNPTGTGRDSFARTLFQLRDHLSVLDESNRALQSSNEILRQFGYAASHDLKSPVRTIRTFLSMLQEEYGSLGEPADEWIRYVRDAADTLHRLQQGLWTFSRVDRDAEFVPVDLNEIVGAARAALAGDLRDVDLVIEPLPVVLGIAPQLLTVYTNLLQNAVEHRSENRQLSIVISIVERQTDVIVSVSDNGSGFPSSASDRIFELFTRLDPKAPDRDGLGLAICRRIIQHHGGWIRADGELGRGARFEMLLRKPSEDT